MKAAHGFYSFGGYYTYIRCALITQEKIYFWLRRTWYGEPIDGGAWGDAGLHQNGLKQNNHLNLISNWFQKGMQESSCTLGFLPN
jgi:hypothetical protein